MIELDDVSPFYSIFCFVIGLILIRRESLDKAVYDTILRITTMKWMALITYLPGSRI